MKVNSITGMDTYRDGGSISVSFTCNGRPDECTLLFRILKSPVFDKIVLGPEYMVPIIEVYEQTTYYCTMTNKSIPDVRKSNRESSWTEALNILMAMKNLTKNYTGNYDWVYGKMLEYSKKMA